MESNRPTPQVPTPSRNTIHIYTPREVRGAKAHEGCYLEAKTQENINPLKQPFTSVSTIPIHVRTSMGHPKTAALLPNDTPSVDRTGRHTLRNSAGSFYPKLKASQTTLKFPPRLSSTAILKVVPVCFGTTPPNFGCCSIRASRGDGSRTPDHVVLSLH